MKIDNKAYDRIKWGYLRTIMLKIGFATQWVDWMMLCVTTVSYKISMNGDIVGPISPNRGLRQGDPFSPYLFILCVEGLSSLINQAENIGDIHGCKVC